MAEEGTIGLERGSRERVDDEEPSKEELQRRMEEARESISQTVTEIKEAVTNQYNSMKETVTEALDWRHHFRKNPVAFSIGALSAGFLVGYAVAGRIRGGSGDEDYASYEESDLYARTGAEPLRLDESAGTSYQEQDDYAQSASYEETGRSGRPRAAALYSAGAANQEEEERGPSLYERFKGTSAYERLEKEVSSLGDRFIEELSTTAQTVVLPSLFNKLKELFGVDLSGKKGQQQQARPPQSGGLMQQTEAGGSTGGAQQGTQGATNAQAGQAGGQNAQAASASASLASASRGSDYGTSENKPYGTEGSAQGGTGRSAGGTDSILDLDR